MSNQALPKKSREFAERYVEGCQNLGLILDKLAPWGLVPQKEHWDLRGKVIRKKGEKPRDVSGGEAKGIWLSTSRKALSGETASLFEVERTDKDLMVAKQTRWLEMVTAAKGLAFTIKAAERLVVGLGAAHVLETTLTLDRNTGLPYLPGSAVKGLARAWGLIELAGELDIQLDKLNDLDEALMEDDVSYVLEEFSDKSREIEIFRRIFGWKKKAGAVSFLDAIYRGKEVPRYAADVMTPHYPKYYSSQDAPAEDDGPNPVSFITVDSGNIFAFGIVPCIHEASVGEDMNTAAEWLIDGLVQLGAGSKTAAGYGYFSRKSIELVVDSRSS